MVQSETIFLISLGVALLLLVQTYLLYPWTLHLFARLFRKAKKPTPGELPGVSIIIAAYNEEAILNEKILNTLEIRYPNLEVLIGSDGSADRTAEILQEWQSKSTENSSKIRSFIYEKNRGKAAVLNDLVKEASYDVLLFCDANTMMLPNVLNLIMRHFDNPQVGCVSGRLVLKDSGKTSLGQGETLYWNFETEIKRLEGNLGVLMGANGALYAIRKELYTPIPVNRTIMDDFFVSVKPLRSGFDNVFEPRAVGIESTSKSNFGEYERKKRIGRANLNFIFTYLSLLNPIRPLVAYAFFSHKLIRWISPLLIIAVLVFNILLLPYHNLWLALLIAQILFHLAAIWGHLLNLKGQKNALTTIPYYFDIMNFALFSGFFKILIPEKSGGWKRIAREESDE